MYRHGHFPVWLSLDLTLSHILTLCILLWHYTADPCWHSLCPLGCFTSPFSLLSSSFYDVRTHSHSPKSPVQSPPPPIHAVTCKSAEIPNCTRTPWVLPHRSPGPHCSRWTWNCVNQEDCSTDKTCSFVSSSPNHHLSQAAGLAAASGRVWAFRAKQCPAKKPFYPSWASELYMSCPSPLPSHLTVM